MQSRDQEFYRKIDVTPPTLSPEERMRRRFAFRNERVLYKRKCDATQKEIISCFSNDVPFPVYSPEAWWADSWDGLIFARKFDFNRPFFEQFAELEKLVPHISLHLVQNQNCSYSNYLAFCKNCYLCFGSVYSEDCFYGSPYGCKNCIDTLLTRDSQWCYETITCENCYECFYCQDCVDSQNLIFCYDCKSCKNCIGCVGLRNKEYFIHNQKFTKEDFLNFKNSFDIAKFEELKKITPRLNMTALHSENVSGNYIYDSKNTFYAFDVQRCQDCSYVAQVIDMKDCYDCNYTEENELCYEYIGYVQNNRIFFSVGCKNSHDIWYSAYCMSCSDCFGCVGLKRKKYCIFNKQYTKEEYFDFKNRIAEHMRKTGEYGEFFPISISPFAYNESVANEYFPLEQEKALEKGYKWAEIPAREVPKDATPDVHTCKECNKPFRTIKQEEDFYKQMKLQTPQKCPDCRHKDRLAKRPQRILIPGNCRKCGIAFESPHQKDSLENIYCEKCYLEVIY